MEEFGSIESQGVITQRRIASIFDILYDWNNLAD
jgi:hypothetical protein